MCYNISIKEKENLYMVGYIYMIRNKENGRVYVGKTMNRVKERVQRHFREALTTNNSNELAKEIRKYGIESFEFDVLEEVHGNNREEVNDRLYKLEMFYAEKYDCFGKGYNYLKTRNKPNKTGVEKGRKFNGKGGTGSKVKICMYDQKGNLVKKFNRVKDITEELDVHRSSVSNCLSRRKPHLKGYIFRWEDETLDMNEYVGERFICQSKKIDYRSLFKGKDFDLIIKDKNGFPRQVANAKASSKRQGK